MSSLTPDTTKYDLNLQLQACTAHRRRNGKVARLPAVTRDHINRMMDDGVPYKTIIERLGPAGQHLIEQNLSHWRYGGYHDHQKAQLLKDRALAQTKAAADLVRNADAITPFKLQEACTKLALLQYLETVAVHGEKYAQDSLAKNPTKFITLINACVNLNNSELAAAERRLSSGAPLAPASAQNQLSASTSLSPNRTLSHPITHQNSMNGTCASATSAAKPLLTAGVPFNASVDGAFQKQPG